ncbi:MAG: hypothetical protein JKY53_06450 [Flavobacteriales bacterium]|nr:hypothetical protein [Flavobacteriales bacterium]
MSKAVYRNFRKQYGVDLLSKSTENDDIGQKVEWDFGKLDIDHITFIDDLNLPIEQANNLISKLKKTNLVKASFADMELNKQAFIKIGAFIPNIGTGFKSGFGFSKMLRVQFSDIWAKEMSGDILREIVGELKHFEKNHSKEFKKKLAKDLVIESLYYANKVELIFENSTERDMKAAVEYINIDFETRVEATAANKIVFKGSKTLPFAAKFSALKDFID